MFNDLTILLLRRRTSVRGGPKGRRTILELLLIITNDENERRSHLKFVCQGCRLLRSFLSLLKTFTSHDMMGACCLPEIYVHGHVNTKKGPKRKKIASESQGVQSRTLFNKYVLKRGPHQPHVPT